MIQEMNTRMFVSKYAKEPYEDIESELISILENKDERFRKMGMYFNDERKEAFREEFNKLKL